ncbi:MAG: metalloregulator ArsR/SmtB family transcription factor [Lagierella massiliensis]|nr:metalloregulator ArsR/SmtB family transcription factor [Lagierella massiliensis]
MTDNKITAIFKCLCDLNRLKILKELGNGELCACELLDFLDISQSTLSYHMKNMVECDLVLVRQVGKWSYYRINKEIFLEFKEYIQNLNFSDLKKSNY